MDPCVEVVIAEKGGHSSENCNEENDSHELVLSPSSLKFVPALVRKASNPTFSSSPSSSSSDYKEKLSNSECHIVTVNSGTTEEEEEDTQINGTSPTTVNTSIDRGEEEEEVTIRTPPSKSQKKSILSKLRRTHRHKNHQTTEKSQKEQNKVTMDQREVVVSERHDTKVTSDQLPSELNKHMNDCDADSHQISKEEAVALSEEHDDRNQNDNEAELVKDNGSSDATTTTITTREIEVMDDAKLNSMWGNERMEFSKQCTLDNVLEENYQEARKIKPKGPLNPSWASIEGPTFSVRTGPNYAKKKKKLPSASSLYELVEVRLFESKCRTLNIADKFPLPTNVAYPDSKVPVIHPNYPHVPEILVVHFHFPSESPNFFKPKDDGNGGELVLYLKPSQEFLNEINHSDNPSPAAKLFGEWCTKCTDSFEWRSRFKCMALVRDLEKHNISILKPYNGKPVLITESGKARRGVSADGIRYLEFVTNGT